MRLVAIDYTNWRGERRWRIIEPLVEYGHAVMRFRSTEYHPEPQWVLMARDIEKPGELRGFAMSGIHAWLTPTEAIKQPEVLAILRRLQDREVLRTMKLIGDNVEPDPTILIEIPKT